MIKGRYIKARNSVGKELIKTGANVSYNTDDDGQTQNGRLSDFETLDTNNVFGNTDRFTDESGGQTYTNGIVLDHSQDNGSSIMVYKQDLEAAAYFSTSLTNATSKTFAGLSTWYVWNINEFNAIWNKQNSWVDKFPSVFNYGSSNIWTSNSRPDNTAFGLYIRAEVTIPIYFLGKLNNLNSVICRRTTYAELGI